VVTAAAVVVEDRIIIIAEVIMSKGMVDKDDADASGHWPGSIFYYQPTQWFCWLFACQGCGKSKMVSFAADPGCGRFPLREVEG
jgi:hypothetical protein